MKHMSPHLRNSGTAKAYSKPSAKPEPSSIDAKNSPLGTTAVDANYGAEEKSHPHAGTTHGTEPHPTTGVHAIHVHHHGDGHYITHTHHEDGQVAVDHHQGEDAMHAHVTANLPNGNAGHEAAESPEYESAEEGAMSALGGNSEG